MANVYARQMYDLIRNNPKIGEFELVDELVETFYGEIVSQDDQKLLNLAFCEKVEQSQIDKFLEEWDIERFGGNKALMLAYVMKQHPDLNFSDYAGPRLSGLLNFWRFKNLNLISHFTKIVREMNKNGIVPMILKGGAMKYLRQDLPRVMGDIDILVQTLPEYNKSKEISKKMGYVFLDEKDNAPYSVDLHLPNNEDGVLDIHAYLDFGERYNKRFLKNLFERAEKKQVFGAEVFVPSVEDMLFIGLLNMTKNLRFKTSVSGILYTLFDCHYLQSVTKKLRWDIILDNIAQTHTQAQMYIAMKFANRVVSGLLPEDLLEDDKLQKSIIDCCNQEIFYCKYVDEVKYICKGLKWHQALGGWHAFKYYVKNELLHFVVKNIRKSKCLVNIFMKVARKK